MRSRAQLGAAHTAGAARMTEMMWPRRGWKKRAESCPVASWDTPGCRSQKAMHSSRACVMQGL